MFGDLYRLNNPLEGNLFCEMLVAKDKRKAHITMMLPIHVPNGKMIRIYPRGLCPDTEYEILELGLTKRGDTWMNLGFLASVPFGDFGTKTYHIMQV